MEVLADTKIATAGTRSRFTGLANPVIRRLLFRRMEGGIADVADCRQ